MKHLLVVAALIVCLPVRWVSAQETPSPALSSEEKEELTKLLDESFDLLIGLITGVSDEQWNFKQAPDRWSVGQCAQHIVRSEAALLQNAQAALAKDPDPDWFEKTKGKTEMLRRGMPNRQPMGQGGATAPMEIRPDENWSRGKTIEEFYKIRGKVHAYIEMNEMDLKAYTQEHPFPFFNWLTAHDWLIYIPLHTIRHSRQIIEVKEADRYPDFEANTDH